MNLTFRLPRQRYVIFLVLLLCILAFLFFLWNQKNSPSHPEPNESGAMFKFETGSDDLSKALTSAYRAYVTAPADGESFRILMENEKKAQQYFAAHPDETTQRLLDEIKNRDPELSGFMFRIVFHLLGQFPSNRGIDYLYEQAMVDLPHDLAKLDSHPDFPPVRIQLRQSALSALGAIAIGGSKEAQTRILKIVEQAKDLDVKANAIKIYYSCGEIRSKAKRILAEKLKPDERYLLNEVL